jgi:CBS domain containing-hemolysin-like protein
VFREFQRRKTHIAMVVDEYGRLAGLVTMEDLLQSLFGDLADSQPSGPLPMGPPTPAPTEGG